MALAWRQSKPACFRLKSMMLKLFKIEQRKGKQRRGGPMGVYANGAALRAMAAVEQVHLVVISTFTGPSAGKGFKGHGRVIKGRPFDRVAVYPPNDGRPLRRFKSWANDIVPVLLRPATGVVSRVRQVPL